MDGKPPELELDLSRGIDAQRAGDHDAALIWRLFAYRLALGTPFIVPASRDVAASLLKGAAPAEDAPVRTPEEYLCESRIIADQYVGKVNGMYRERGATCDYLGRLKGHQAIVHEQMGGNIGKVEDEAASALDAFKQGWHDLRTEEKKSALPWPLCIDQYRVNMAPRRAAIMGLYGKSMPALGAGVGACGLAVLSESPRLEHSNKTLSRPELWKVKGRHLGGALGGLAVSLLAGGTQPGQVSNRRSYSLELARRLFR